jgi:hypothetical protein
MPEDPRDSIDDLVYTKYKKPQVPPFDGSGVNSKPGLPTINQLLEKQRHELVEIAQIRYGIKGSKIDLKLIPLNISSDMSESQIMKMLLTAPEQERADQVLYGLATGLLEADMANRILAGLAILGKFKKICIE